MHSSLSNVNEKNVYDVVILGAGLAGLGAATVLHGSNVNFRILEAQNYIGGRVKTISMLPVNNPKMNLYDLVDVGAQWLHGEHNQLYEVANRYKLLLKEVSEEGLGPYIREDGYVFDDFFQKKIDFIVGQILEECEIFSSSPNPPKSVAHYLAEKFDNYVSENINSTEDRTKAMQLLDWHRRFQIIDNSCLYLDEVSAKSWGLYSFNGENCQAHINFRRGFGSLISAIAKEVGETNIETETIVDSINWNIKKNDSNLILIRTKNGCEYFANHVIVTFSIGVLKAQAPNLFKPTLPKYIHDTIQSLGFEAINKIFLQFDNSWWNDMKAVQLVFNDDDYKNKKWTRHLSGFDILSPGAPNTILGWVGGLGAIEMEKLTDHEIINDCIEILSRFMKLKIPKPIKYFCSRWGTNQFIRGGYSYISTKGDNTGSSGHAMTTPITIDDLPVVSTELNSRNFKDIAITSDDTKCNILYNYSDSPLLLFAGEACHDKYFSTAHGAFLSGIEQAQKVLKYF